MSRMAIESGIVRKLAHGAAKPLNTLIQMLEIYDTKPDRGLHSEETRKHYVRFHRALAECLMDLRLIALCEEGPEVNQPINWKTIIHENLPGSFKPIRLSNSLTWDGKEEDYIGTGAPGLLAAAVSNMGWFNNHFWGHEAGVRLSLFEKDGRPWINCAWDFGDAITVDRAFAAFDPFFPMSSNDLGLEESTGLVFQAVKRVLELHGGHVIADWVEKSFKLEWLCPKSNQR